MYLVNCWGTQKGGSGIRKNNKDAWADFELYRLWIVESRKMSPNLYMILYNVWF